ncbi:MAG: peptidylprolyl isomerase [bacterium]|nr:peptidylprolyl isomerase [bacterium]
MQEKKQQAPQQAQQEVKVTEDFNKNIKDLGLVILIVAVAGWALFKYDSRNENNNSNNQTKEQTMEKPAIKQVEKPTKEEAAKYDAIADKKIVVIETNKGVIKAKLYAKDAPYTVASFMKLIENGLYDGLIFHRVIAGFMIQGGDPYGNGTGGPGYKFDDELNAKTVSYKAGYKKGVLAMANSGPNTNGSQFFIMLEDYQLPKNYTIFGKVTVGQEVVDAIGKVATDKSNDKPLEDVKITKVYLEDVK